MRKKSIRKAARDFVTNIDGIVDFTNRTGGPQLTDQDQSWCYDLAIIRVYREFEDLMLSCLVALINSDASTFSQLKGRNFPDHMNVEVCEYLVYGDGYFDFSGRDGLISTIKKFVPATHWLPTAVKKPAYKDALERMCALRNFAAHDSSVSKKRALASIDQERMSSSGAWLKKQGRLVAICDRLKQLANEILAAAPY
ncbi:MAG: hypothetical protein AB7F91_16370 [Parvularculaceae bacterium]